MIAPRAIVLLALLLVGCTLTLPAERAAVLQAPTTIDGAPVVTIASPLPNAVYQAGVTVFVQALIANAGADIARVEIAVDARVIETLTRPNPDGMNAFSAGAAWAAAAGEHVITVTAFRADDSASAPAQVAITVVTGSGGATILPSSTSTSAPSPTTAPTDLPTDVPARTPTRAAPTAPPIPTVAPRAILPTAGTVSPDALLSLTLALTPAGGVTSSTPTMTVTGVSVDVTFNQGANIRRGPASSFEPPIRTMPSGITVPAVAVDPTGLWYKVLLEDGEGWVFMDLVNVMGDPALLPIDPGPPTPTSAFPLATNTPLAVNLRIADMGIDTQPPRCNESFVVRAAITNTGSQNSPATMARLRDLRTADASQQGEWFISLPTVQPGVTIRVEVPVTVSTWHGEEHELALLLDPNNTISESDEDDNRRTLRYLLDRAACP